MDSPLLTLAETAKYLKVSPSGLRIWVQAKRLPCVKIGRRRLFIKRVLDERMESGNVLDPKTDGTASDS